MTILIVIVTVIITISSSKSIWIWLKEDDDVNDLVFLFLELAENACEVYRDLRSNNI